MAISIQTNVNSLLAQENLRINSNFQSQTIQRLTSGYRINQSGDDAAGLVVANMYRSNTSELTQGVRNANDGLSALQIVDGGLNNISKMLDRLKTLATQSASMTFTGDRNTLNNEYQSLLSEIDRQASNIGLVSGGRYNTNTSVYIGGGSTIGNAAISVDLSGAANQVDSGGLGVGSTNIVGSSAGFANNSQLVTNGGTYLNAANANQVFNFNDYEGGTTAAFNVTVTSGSGTTGISANQALSQLNTQLDSHNIQAVIGSDNKLAFTGTVAFSVSATAASGGNGLVTGAKTANNSTLFNMGATAVNVATFTGSETMSVQFANANGTAVLALSNLTTNAAIVNAINNATKALGIYAVTDASGGISIQSTLNFAISSLGGVTTGVAAAGSLFGLNAASSSGTLAVTAATAAPTDSTANATIALSTISRSVSSLGLVQGTVGAAQNKLSYAIQLAQSQISSFSAAESRIRDTDVAAEAANLTKAQVLQQASIAAMSQANSAPQAVLALLR